MVWQKGIIELFGFFLPMSHRRWRERNRERAHAPEDVLPCDVVDRVARAKSGTLPIRYGVALCVAGLGFIGYLGLASHVMYTQWGQTVANVGIGVAGLWAGGMDALGPWAAG
jgi:hypothetical protein